MTANEVNSEWIELASMLDLDAGELVPLNSSEFILVTNTQGIVKYNKNENKWTSFCQYPSVEHPFYSSRGSAFNKQQNKLYTYSFLATMTVIDLESHTLQTYEDCGVNDKMHPCLICVNGTIHLIGAQKYDKKTGINAKHFVWDQNTHKLKQIAVFKQFSDIDGACYIYIPKKNVILLVGGRDEPYWADDSDSDSESNAVFGHIYAYSLETQKWTVLNVEFSGCWCACAMTSDQRHVIIVGGYDEHYNEYNNVYVLRISDDGYMLKRSSITVPVRSECEIALTGGVNDEILVIGYLRRLFKSGEFKGIELPPFYLLEMIANFYSVEMLHWFQFRYTKQRRRQHFTIPIKQILTSIED